MNFHFFVLQFTGLVLIEHNLLRKSEYFRDLLCIFDSVRGGKMTKRFPNAQRKRDKRSCLFPNAWWWEDLFLGRFYQYPSFILSLPFNEKTR